MSCRLISDEPRMMKAGPGVTAAGVEVGEPQLASSVTGNRWWEKIMVNSPWAIPVSVQQPGRAGGTASRHSSVHPGSDPR